VDERDISKTPPSREFLEANVDAARFAEFLSRRSPVFKTRPLPSTRREAIALMLEQPNLIKRPVLVKGSRVVFGFDRPKYDELFG
jgi:arsenate reductase